MRNPVHEFLTILTTLWPLATRTRAYLFARASSLNARDTVRPPLLFTMIETMRIPFFRTLFLRTSYHVSGMDVKYFFILCVVFGIRF